LVKICFMLELYQSLSFEKAAEGVIDYPDQVARATELEPRVVKSVKEGRVLRVVCDNGISFTVFISNERIYLLSRNSCNCPAFLYSLYKNNKGSCYHIKAFNYAEDNDKIVVKRIDSTTCYNVLMDLLSYGKSLILQRLWLSRERNSNSSNG
jgi:predicted nucleic acid-binding Zn finger protein